MWYRYVFVLTSSAPLRSRHVIFWCSGYCPPTLCLHLLICRTNGRVDSYCHWKATQPLQSQDWSIVWVWCRQPLCGWNVPIPLIFSPLKLESTLLLEGPTRRTWNAKMRGHFLKAIVTPGREKKFFFPKTLISVLHLSTHLPSDNTVSSPFPNSSLSLSWKNWAGRGHWKHSWGLRLPGLAAAQLRKQILLKTTFKKEIGSL